MSKRSMWQVFRDVRDAIHKPVSMDEYALKLKERGLLVSGELVPDPVPIAPPIGYKRTPSMVDIVREMVRGERLAQEARAAGYETFEESEDFDVEDDPAEMSSPWVNEFDPPLSVLLQAGREALNEKEKAAKKADQPGGGGGTPPPEGP